ncbi:hypothetical protein L198_08006 [Cryptococcus wingfieldii CBS 7118]|uniref:Major facilitator superfamily (MFS) profile domain-containing protein n=1 Tax=Cryptococcus wingfieldii CBS 7118 TaxID=1295528 RepID=A0A1E3HP29_9TREE|nr:hypothetical protein L198_08006 [Cryptococcus wingfieldii CBS 7118]ODN78087.1 hypothetical protein L198_08006 [Cryptococcus wingfieldii CBS 7118]
MSAQTETATSYVSPTSIPHTIDHDKTAVDLNQSNKESTPFGPASPSSTASLQSEDAFPKHEEAQPGGIPMSKKRKWFLLLIFSVAQYLDGVAVCGLFVVTDSIQGDLKIEYENSSWVVTSYSVTFASFLMFWGRVSDLYSAKQVFA